MCSGVARVTSSNRVVAKAASVTVAAIFISRVLGLVREMVISHMFGQNRQTDIYVAAFKLPDLLFFLIAGGALSSSFIPVFTSYLSTGKEKDAWKVFSVIATIMAVVIGAFIVVGEVFARQIVPIAVAPGFSPDELDLVAHLTRIILPSQLFFFLGGLMMGTLYARQKFLVPGLGPSVYNIGIIGGGLFLGHVLGIEGLAWGALVGAFAGNFLMQLLAVRKAGVEFRPSFDHRHEGVRKVWKLMLPVILGLSLPQVDVLVNAWFASFLWEGAVSALDRANRMMQIPLGIFAQGMAIAFFPTLSALAAKGEVDEFRRTINLGIRSILYLTIPCSVLLMVLAVPVFQFLLQSGQFTAYDTRAAAGALVFYALGIFAWSGQAIIARGFYARQDTLTVVVTGTIMTLLFIPMNYVLMKVMGYRGLALATTIAAALHMLTLLEILRRQLKGIHGNLLLNSVGKVVASSALMGGLVWALQSLVGGPVAILNLPSRLEALVVLLIAGGSGIVLYVLLTHLLRVDESRFALDLLRRRFRRRTES
ncbi:MAG: murein biosynthesis integral membrane protein MurJ [Armatimonadetes bacterium CG2_30_59_28]|nr:MAG: murein biosynthesis integral membrane protein MurJ [Armatimonadetes bacterium CG2_30_59_28]